MVNIGVIGAGRIGRLHIENLHRLPAAVLRAVADINASALETVEQAFSPKYVTSSAEDILHDPEIDAVFICAATSEHISLIDTAIQNKKHIFCEKPISFDIEESRRVVKAAKEAGLVFQLGFNRRFDPSFQQVRKMRVNGQIGTPEMLQIISRDPSPPPMEYVANSGGLFVDMTIHDFDMARYIMGENIAAISVHGGALIDKRFNDYGDIDTAIISLTFESGAVGVIENSRRAVYGYDQRLEIFGSNGAATVPNQPIHQVEWWQEDFIKSEKPVHFFLERYQTAFEREIAMFAESVQSGTPAVCTGDDGIAAQTAALAAAKAWKEKKTVYIADVESETIEIS
jgi:myo-inositol 2-dehydrogenase/D-chiro-inositol 1-dehydrogenase